MSFFRIKSPSSQVTSFTKSLSSLLSSGVNLADALYLISAAGNSLENKIAKTVHQKITQGYPLVEVLKEHPQWFDGLYIHMLEAGYKTGKVDTFLLILTNYRDTRDQLHQQIMRAITYPLFVCFIAFILTITLLTQVIPRFSHLFSEGKNNLPYMTNLLMSASNFLVEYGLYLSVFFLLLLVVLKLALGNKTFKNIFKEAGIKLPLIKSWINIRTKEAYIRSLGTLLKAEVSLIDSTRIASSSCVYKSKVKDLLLVTEQLAKGYALDQAWSKIPWFSKVDVLVAYTGRKGGNLGDLLLLRADDYQLTINRRIKLFIQLLEPLLMLFVGGIIGVIILAVYMPVLSIGQLV